ncbi:deoxycytidylate deaminase-like protein [Leptotrombidium deliense]|uniref:Probable deoxycytidylate deaminase n=1 Tax=Leptotrombidium deliense TaxID=299467 RepID=A0A443SWF6_9ACAR|nr:deoxycytidylate deaminase-like protein [Leptotrombidium deliense]
MSDSAVSKREDYLQWDEYFMAVACLSAMRSKDPHTQVGACIVNAYNQIVGAGYNGMPVGCSDDDLPWNKSSDNPVKTKYLYVCHAELNAIMNKNSADVVGCTLYTTLFPCNECAKVIIQSRIKNIVYLNDKHNEKPEFIASRMLLKMANIPAIQFTPKHNQIVIEFTQKV